MSRNASTATVQEPTFNPSASIHDNLIADLRVLWNHFNSQASPNYENNLGETVPRTPNAIRFATNMRDKVQKMAGLVNGLR